MSNLRQQILDASAAIVAKEGVRALSFREVARRAGVSHQAPYHYFESDQAILRAIAEDGFSRLAKLMEKKASLSASNPIERLTASGLAYVEFARENPGHFRVMFQNSVILAGQRSKPLLESEAAYGVLERLAQEAKKSGLAKDIELEELVLLCWSTVHGVATLVNEGHMIGPNKKAQMNMADMVVKNLGRFLKPQAPGRKV